VPDRLSWRGLRRVVEAIDSSSAIGKRDRALLFLFVTTGLRSQEVRRLKLSDIRWRTSELRVRCTKAQRERVVPLLEEAGTALADYVLHGRPRTAEAMVFLCHRPPFRPLRHSGTVSRIIRHRLAQCGIERPRAGAHLFRHSLAILLVSQGRPIKEVADLLGHRSIDTTGVYVKVVLPQLSDIGLPFPGGDA